MSVIRTYRSKDGRHLFKFRFVQETSHVDIYCLAHPALSGENEPHKTHLFPSGRLCFVEGKEPRDQAQAEKRAMQWAEYFLDFRRTGIAQR